MKIMHRPIQLSIRWVKPLRMGRKITGWVVDSKKTSKNFFRNHDIIMIEMT